MDQIQAKYLPLKSVYALLQDNGFGTDATVLRTAIPGKGSAEKRAKKGMALEILRTKSLYDKFISEFWPNGMTTDGKKRIERYDRDYQKWKNSVEGSEDDAEDTSDDADRFAYEDDLRDYLAKNPSLLEPGMMLWDVGDSRDATEFHVDDDHRRVDILAKDRNGIPVVIELKVSKGHEKVIGQALYYKECIKDKLGVPRVRTIIVARKISHELRVALRAVTDVELFEYRLSMTLTKI